MLAIRWKKRRHGWAGFVGSCRAAVRIRREGRRITVALVESGRRWLNARNVPAAMQWAHAQLVAVRALPPRPPEAPALFVGADGRVEWRTVPLSAREWQLTPAAAVPRLLGPPGPPSRESVHTRSFVARMWRWDIHDELRGCYGRVEVRVFVEAGADPLIVEVQAQRALHRMARGAGLQ